MVDDDHIVRAMASNSIADETPLYSAGLKYVLSDVAKDYPFWKLRMESDLHGYSLWPLSSGGAGVPAGTPVLHLPCMLYSLTQTWVL